MSDNWIRVISILDGEQQRPVFLWEQLGRSGKLVWLGALVWSGAYVRLEKMYTMNLLIRITFGEI